LIEASYLQDGQLVRKERTMTPKYRETVCKGSDARPLGLPFNQMGVIGLFTKCSECGQVAPAKAGKNGYAHSYRVGRHHVRVLAN
jgi:hypothetical protein